MTWAMFYLVCFVVGVTLSVLSFLGGSFHMPHVHVHVPHGGVHVAGGAHAGGGAEMPFLNFGTITAFLAWFGGTGYLLTRYSSLVVAGVLVSGRCCRACRREHRLLVRGQAAAQA